MNNNLVFRESANLARPEHIERRKRESKRGMMRDAVGRISGGRVAANGGEKLRMCGHADRPKLVTYVVEDGVKVRKLIDPWTGPIECQHARKGGSPSFKGPRAVHVRDYK